MGRMIMTILTSSLYFTQFPNFLWRACAMSPYYLWSKIQLLPHHPRPSKMISDHHHSRSSSAFPAPSWNAFPSLPRIVQHLPGLAQMAEPFWGPCLACSGCPTDNRAMNPRAATFHASLPWNPCESPSISCHPWQSAGSSCLLSSLSACLP